MPDEERIEKLELEVKVLRANNKGLKGKIDEQSKEIEELKEENENLLDALNNSIDIKKYWVNKDKIKAKIEEYEEKIKKIKKKDVWEEPYDTEKYVRYTNYISVLRSLLEKE